MVRQLNNIPVTLQLLDSPRRDLEHKIVLAYHLAAKGIASIIGTQPYIRKIHSQSKNSIWLGRLGSNDGNHNKDKFLRGMMSELNTKLFYLHDEGAFFLRGYFKNGIIQRHSPDLVKEIQTARFFFWGEKQKEIFASLINAHKETLLATVGAPRLDLCKQKYEKLDQEQISYLKTTYGNFILFCTRFGNFNAAPDVISPFSKRRFEIYQSGFSSQPEAMNHVFERWHKAGNDFIAFIKLIQKAAFAHPDQLFLVRPHPSEDKRFYEEAFNEFSNIIIDNTGDLRPIIRAAKLVIHSECTSGLESVLSGTPSINFVPNQENYPDLCVEGLDELPPVARTVEQVLEMISDHINGKIIGDTSLPTSLLNIIYNIEHEAIPTIANYVYNFCLENNLTTSFRSVPVNQQASYLYQSAKKVAKPVIKGPLTAGKKVPLTHFNVEKLFENVQKIIGTKANLKTIASDHIIITP